MVISKYFLIPALSVILVASSCTKSDNQVSISYNYAGAGAAGDVMTFMVNESVLGYNVYNESNKRYAQGSYVVYSDELNGLYKVYTNGSFYYAAEIHDQVFIGNFPTARQNNNLSCGISVNGGIADTRVFGTYVYLHVSNTAINGSAENREWGLLTLASDGRWMKQGYCNAAGALPKMMPDEYTGSVPPASPSDSGSWIVSQLYPNRLIMNQLHSGDSITGFPLASDSGAILVMDLGYGHGFLVGLKLLEGSPNPIKGGFGYADVRYDATTGGGKYVVNDSLYVDWWRADAYGKIKNGMFGILYQSAVLKNVYYSKNVTFNSDVVDFYTVVSGKYFMEFQFRGNKFCSYGIGARVP